MNEAKHMDNSLEKLKRACSAIYFLDGAKEPADDCSGLLRWAVAEIERLRAVLLDMRLAEVGGTLRIGVIADDGAASAEIGPLHQDTFRAWWKLRNAALNHD